MTSKNPRIRDGDLLQERLNVPDHHRITSQEKTRNSEESKARSRRWWAAHPEVPR